MPHVPKHSDPHSQVTLASLSFSEVTSTAYSMGPCMGLGRWLSAMAARTKGLAALTQYDI